MNTVDAWVLRSRTQRPESPTRGRGSVLSYEPFDVGTPDEDEALVEPLIGSWEANLDHALARTPIDVCGARGEERVVIGNLGVVRVLVPGAQAQRRGIREGQLCLVIPIQIADRHGYTELVWAYDAPKTHGLLARRTRLRSDLLLPLPVDSRHDIASWATHARYFTAWDNWKVARAAFVAQVPDADPRDNLVFSWGGGVGLAELLLAKREGFRVAMATGSDHRIAQLRSLGIEPVDRRLFDIDDAQSSAGTLSRVGVAAFVEEIAQLSDGRGVSILLDNIGAPVYRATLKSLGREGVLSTCGWKAGMRLTTLRASECISRHTHVHTHVWRVSDSPTIRDFVEEVDWLLPANTEAIYRFDEIPTLATDYASGAISDYFPLYEVNPI